jgi:hypothetical protein
MWVGTKTTFFVEPGLSFPPMLDPSSEEEDIKDAPPDELPLREELEAEEGREDGLEGVVVPGLAGAMGMASFTTLMDRPRDDGLFELGR